MGPDVAETDGPDEAGSSGHFLGCSETKFIAVWVSSPKRSVEAAADSSPDLQGRESAEVRDSASGETLERVTVARDASFAAMYTFSEFPV